MLVLVFEITGVFFRDNVYISSALEPITLQLYSSCVGIFQESYVNIMAADTLEYYVVWALAVIVLII